MTKKYSNEIAMVVRNVLDTNEFKYSFREEDGIFKLGMMLEGKINRIEYIINVGDAHVSVYGIAPICADINSSDQMANMAQFLHRANCGLKNGCFEFDYDDGEIRYHSFIDCEGNLPSDEAVRNSIFCTASMFERYSGGIVDMMFTAKDAKTAVEECENRRIGGSRAGALNDLLKTLETMTNEGEISDEEVEELVGTLKTNLFGEEGGEE